MAANAWDAPAYDTQFGFVGRYGDDVLDLLDPQPGESILDLGCGTGRHAAQLVERGSSVVGVDLDDGMLSKARHDHPGIPFLRADATAFTLSDLDRVAPFDACFSNAALHWMTPQDAVLRNVRGALVDGARFVAEMGGAENIAALDVSLRLGLAEVGLEPTSVVTNYFPTVGEQASALEAAGFRVELMTWFRRPTPLAHGSTPADWTRHFRSAAWSAVPQDRHAELADAINSHALELGLRTSAGWYADYCRLRFVAVTRPTTR